MADTGTILFLCPHNAAKSLLAVAEFERLARERGLRLRADSAGTEPAEAPAPAVVAALGAEGIDVAGYLPRLVTREEMANAHRVVSMGCDAAALPVADTPVAQWDDVPPVSLDLAAARAAIDRHVAVLVAELQGERG